MRAARHGRSSSSSSRRDRYAAGGVADQLFAAVAQSQVVWQRLHKLLSRQVREGGGSWWW